MPTTRAWKQTNSGYIFDLANYADGTAFAPGDTLVINGGAIQVGSMAAPGSILFKMYDLSLAGLPASVTNTGSITLQNGSRFQNFALLDNNDALLNATGAVLSVSSGSMFGNPDPTAPFGAGGTTNSAKIINNGLIAVNGAAGRTTKFSSQGSYSGSGLLSVRGVSGAAPTDTSAEIVYGAASGTFDIASGELSLTKSPAQAERRSAARSTSWTPTACLKPRTPRSMGTATWSARPSTASGRRPHRPCGVRPGGQPRLRPGYASACCHAGRFWIPPAVACAVHPRGQLHAG